MRSLRLQEYRQLRHMYSSSMDMPRSIAAPIMAIFMRITSQL